MVHRTIPLTPLPSRVRVPHAFRHKKIPVHRTGTFFMAEDMGLEFLCIPIQRMPISVINGYFSMFFHFCVFLRVSANIFKFHLFCVRFCVRFVQNGFSRLLFFMFNFVIHALNSFVNIFFVYIEAQRLNFLS